MKNTEKGRMIKLCFNTFFLAGLIFLVCCIMKDISPFGSRSVLQVDLYHQYAPFHEELRYRLLNGKSLFYSWEGGLGKEFIAQLAYYTASPFSFLALLFPARNLPEYILLVMGLKISLSAAVFSWYLGHRFRKQGAEVVIFGLLYGFCAFVCSYFWNIMWLDAVYLLPLTARGIELIVEKRDGRIYLAGLAFTILTNFYIAFLVCIFAVLYFFCVLAGKRSWKKERKEIIGSTVVFCFTSLLAGGLAMFLVIPTAIALSQTATSETQIPGFSVYINLAQLWSNHFLGARPVVLGRNEDLPNIYTGLITMLLLPFFFTCPTIPKKEKVLKGGLVVFLLLCCVIRPLDFFIHGGHFPANLPHRFTFMYSFLILTMAYQVFLNTEYISYKKLLGWGLLYFGVILASEFIAVPLLKDVDRVYSDTDLWLNLAGLVVYGGLLWGYLNYGRSRKILLGLVVCTLAECLFSSYCGIEKTTLRSEYTKYMDDTKAAVEELNNAENGGFFRTEFRRFTAINDPSLYHYHGFSQFSSLAPGGISLFMQKLGVAATGNSYRYYDPTPLTDAMFGIRYVMNKGDGEAGKLNSTRYDFFKRFGTVWVYKNPYDLSAGFFVENSMKDWKAEDSNPFEIQNQFLSLSSGSQAPIFRDVKLSHIHGTNINITGQPDNNTIEYELVDPENLSMVPNITVTLNSEKDQFLYLYVDSANSARIQYETGSERQDRELSAGRSMFEVGKIKAGETVTVSFNLTDKGEFEKTYRPNGTVRVYAAEYSEQAFQQGYEILKEHTWQISQWDDTWLEGNIECPKDGILYTSVPYIKGWSAWVDGEKQEILPLGGNALCGIKLPSGTHQVKMVYKTSGINAGWVISGISLLFTLIYLQKMKRKG